MTDVDTQFSPLAAPRVHDRTGRREVAEFIRRFRRLFVAGSLIFADFISALAAVALGEAMTGLTGSLSLYSFPTMRAALLLVAIFLTVGLYSGSGPSPYERFGMRAFGIAVFIAVGLGAELPASRPAALLVAAITDAICLLLLGHYLEAVTRVLLIRGDLWGARTALVGCGVASRKLAHGLMSRPELGLTPVAFIATSADDDSKELQPPMPSIAMMPCPDRIWRKVEVAIFSSESELAALTARSSMWMPTCRLLLAKDIDDVQSLWIRARSLGGPIGIEINRDLYLRRNRLLKRAVDILIAVPIFLLVCPLIAGLALAIKFIDPGPAFFVQDRVGLNGTVLRMLKIRTMYSDSERRLEEHFRGQPQSRDEWDRFFKLNHDPRVLPRIGHFMRRFSLDELPQLWNVIRGDMGLVGPRPFPSYHMRSFDAEFQTIRVSVLPGLTGMWQISSRSDGDVHVQKAQDLFYIRNWSMLLDAYILLETVRAVLSAKGSR